MTRPTRQMSVGLDTTVMVDVLFILLIFFIVVSQIRTNRIDLELPQVAAGASARSAEAPERPSIVLSITRSGMIHLEDRPIPTMEQLRNELESHAMKRSDGGTSGPPKVLIRTDGRSRSETLVKVLSALSEAGLEAVRFDVERGEGGS